MRALWLTSGYPWQGNPVGFIFHRTQALAVAAEGVAVSVAAPTPWVPPGLAAWKPRWRAYEQAPRTQQDGPVHIRRPRYVTTPRENQLGIAHILQALSLRGQARPDILHAHFAYPAGAAGLALKRAWKVPLVVTLHGDDVTIYPHRNRRMARLFKQVIGEADRVIAVSDALAEQTYAMTGRRPDVLSTGIEISRFDTEMSSAEARRRLALAEDAYVVLFVGALLPQKGVLDLAAALHLLDWDDLACLFVGDGPAKPSGPAVHLLGWRGNDDIPALLRAANVFVLPSWHEGLGQAAVEAGAAGVPVIAARTGGLADLLGEGRGVLFPPHDVEALAAALRHVRAEPAEARTRAEKLRQTVRQRHDLGRNGAALVDIYRSCLGSGGPEMALKRHRP